MRRSKTELIDTAFVSLPGIELREAKRVEIRGSSKRNGRNTEAHLTRHTGMSKT
jgi:hypothetical protein